MWNLRRGALGIGLLVALSCGGDSSSPTPPPSPTVASVRVTPVTDTLRSAGETLQLTANKQVVQQWRAKGWGRGTPDSILTLRFVDIEGGAQVELVQAFVPDDAAAGIKKGWTEHYWKPWRAYLKGAGS